MSQAASPSPSAIDWSKIPAPVDDGAMDHLKGARVADVELAATDGSRVSLARLAGRVIVFAYPRTGVPGEPSLTDDWDQIPGARGCTPQSCAFRDLHKVLVSAGAAKVFGLSTQDTAFQAAAVERLHLPFPLLSDDRLALATAMKLPTMDVAGQTLLKRFALVIDDARVAQVFYPVFPPDRNAADVLAWLEAHPRR